MQAFIEFDIDSRNVAAHLTMLDQKLSDSGLERFLEDHADPYLKDRAEERFTNEGDDAVGMWVPLAPSTVGIRQSLGYGGAHPINVRTRQMLDYLMHSGPDVSGVTGGQELNFPDRGVPAPIQQKIQTAQQGKPFPMTPARPVVALSSTDETEITRSLSEYIIDGLIGGIIP